MAERTGRPQIDALISAFQRSSVSGFWELERFRQPSEAEGRCYEVSEAFTNWLAAQSPDFEYVNAGDWQGESTWYGYEPESWNDPTHAATAIRLDGYTYTIDWTASQYDVTEFPAVRRVLDPGDKPIWERFDIDVPAWETTWDLEAPAPASLEPTAGPAADAAPSL